MKNVIFIALDTLRADHLTCYGYKKQTSPNIESFSKNSIIFENFFAPGIPTQPSYTTFFSGCYPITHRVITHGGNDEINPKVPWSPYIFINKGFTTAAIDNLAVMKKWFLNGYEFYINPSLTLKSKFFQMVKAKEVTERSIEWLKMYHNKNKFFLFIHYWDPHTPYIPPEKYIREFYPKNKNPFSKNNISMDEFYQTPHGQAWSKTWLKKDGKLIRDPEYVEALYDAEIKYMDMYLGKLFDFFAQKKLLENTIIVIFSDHGEIMYKHKGFFDHHGLYDDNIHCPLIIYLPGVKGRRIKNFVQHVDIVKTILEIFNFKKESGMEGKNFLDYITGKKKEENYEYIVSCECTYQAKWCIRDKRYKLIISRRKKDIHSLPPIELYNLENDPEEQKNIAFLHKDKVSEYKEKLEKWIDVKVKENNLKIDPLKKIVPPLGKNWTKFLWEKSISKKGYW